MPSRFFEIITSSSSCFRAFDTVDNVILPPWGVKLPPFTNLENSSCSQGRVSARLFDKMSG
jgi:hypothetical protein